MAGEIADGMAYLASRKYVHRYNRVLVLPAVIMKRNICVHNMLFSLLQGSCCAKLYGERRFHSEDWR